MISRVEGTLVGRMEDAVEVATAGGITYEIEVPLTVALRLPAPGEPVALRTVYRVREELASLYGFLTEGERALFLRLIGVTGVGAKLALAMLSAYPAPRLARALAERDVTALVQVSGVGKKTAERLALELSDRMAGLATDATEAGATGAAQAAVQALVALGMAFQEADRAVRGILEDDPEAETSELLRRVLARR